MAAATGAIATVGMVVGATAELIIVGAPQVGAPTIPYDGLSMIARLSDAMKAARMKKISHIMLGRTALAVAIFSPSAACAKPADQASSSTNQTATAAGVTLQTFVARHEKKILADDTDGDGKVSRTEFLASAKSGKGDPARRFAKLDQNGDGMLDKSEIDAMLTRRFKRQDTNGDGVLSADERAAVHARKTNGAGDGSDS